MFDWIGLYTNIGKIVIMAFQPCHTIGGHSVDPYGLRMTGEHIRHQESLRQTVFCPEFNMDLT